MGNVDKKKAKKGLSQAPKEVWIARAHCFYREENAAALYIAEISKLSRHFGGTIGLSAKKATKSTGGSQAQKAVLLVVCAHCSHGDENAHVRCRNSSRW